MKKTLVLLLTILSITLAFDNYSGYQVIQFSPHNETVLSELLPLIQRPEFDLWSIPHVGHDGNVMVPPEYVKEFQEELLRLNVKFTVIISDVEEYMETERAEREELKWSIELSEGNVTFERFMDFDEMINYLDTVVTQYPDIASIEEIGTSFEGRPLLVIKLSNGPKDSAIFFDSGIHACEWAGPPVSLYAINELTENLAANQAMLDKVDFYFLPMANPDGYVYAQEQFRFWRKTRQPNTICNGTDPNRNWDWHWAEDEPRGECSIQYPGPKAFSEPEVKAIADFLTENKQITAVISIHSFGKYFLHPWGDTRALPPNSKDLARIGKEAADALKAINGTEYIVGSISNLLYLAYGGTSDWVYGALHILLSFTIELPGGGILGFDLPPGRILPVVVETWEAIKVFADNVPDKRGSATTSVLSTMLLTICFSIIKYF